MSFYKNTNSTVSNVCIDDFYQSLYPSNNIDGYRILDLRNRDKILKISKDSDFSQLYFNKEDKYFRIVTVPDNYPHGRCAECIFKKDDYCLLRMYNHHRLSGEKYDVCSCVKNVHFIEVEI